MKHNLQNLTNNELVEIITEAAAQLKSRSDAKVKLEEPIACPIDPNQDRKDAIKLAKSCIEGLKNYRGKYTAGVWSTEVEFIIKHKEKVVVALMKGENTGKIRARGVAKCDPNDCFNAYIGKAIALYRALGKPVPAELIHAPQPVVSEPGDMVELNGRVLKITGKGEKFTFNVNAQMNSVFQKEGKVVDDTK